MRRMCLTLLLQDGSNLPGGLYAVMAVLFARKGISFHPCRSPVSAIRLSCILSWSHIAEWTNILGYKNRPGNGHTYHWAHRVHKRQNPPSWGVVLTRIMSDLDSLCRVPPRHAAKSCSLAMQPSTFLQEIIGGWLELDTWRGGITTSKRWVV